MTDDICPGIPGAARRTFRALGRAGTPESLAALVDIAAHRAAARRIGEADYALELQTDPAEALAVLDLYSLVRPLESGFFAGPRVFEEIPLLVREWSAFADVRVLTALVLGCGRGWSAVSLAATLASAGLPERNWTVDVNGLDVSRKALATAEARRYCENDLAGFPFPRGRWFKSEAGTSRRFREGGGTSLSYGFGDIYLPAVAGEGRRELPGGLVNLLGSFRGRVDLLLARNLTREAPDEAAGVLPSLAGELLREGGLCFTGPGEIWAPLPGMSLEERNGVFYFRKGPEKRKANTFHTPRRGRVPSAAPSPLAGSAAPEPAGYSGLLEASAALLPEDPEGAREKALEAVTLASEDMLAWPPGYEALAKAEEGLGRLAYAGQIREAMELYMKGN
ncbi:MAG: hypothetical protein LBQ79_08485 [Deltaproteobacteria bacterium]|nr:hypothetical protein [Deltaproteobacteria bacterium]